MKSLILTLLLLPICTTAAPRLDWRRSGNNIVFSWRAERNKLYAIEARNSLTGATAFVHFLVSCEPGTASFTAPLNGRAAFYRLVVAEQFLSCP